MDKQKEIIVSLFNECELIKKKFLNTGINSLQDTVNMIIDCFKKGGKLLFFGNGGSAADAQHLAAEFVNRFLIEREALPAIALTTDTSILTCISNDRDYKSVFSRQIEALGKPGDIAFGITTSGKSPNVIYALGIAKKKGLSTIALIGEMKEEIKQYSDIIISVPSCDTPRIQEMHITIGHIICYLVEKNFFNK